MGDDQRAGKCSGALNCRAAVHVHGCYADFGDCDSPAEHLPLPRRRVRLRDVWNRALGGDL